MIWFDTESVGFVGPTTLIQWARDDGEIHLHNVFDQPVSATLRLLEMFCQEPVGGFNIAHDWFHVTRAHAVLRRLDPSKPPTVAGWFKSLRPAVLDSYCLKPPAALDLMLFARKGPMQSLMERDDIRIRRVPAMLAEPLCEELTSRLRLPAIYFSRREDGAAWAVEKDPDDPEFPGVYLKFGANGGLKSLAKHVLGVETVDYPVPSEFKPDQPTWDLFRELPTRLVNFHIAFWRANKIALRYAAQDVELLRGLHQAWGCPPPGDDDSELAICVGASRWRGWPIDIPFIEGLLKESLEEASGTPTDWRPVLAELRRLAGPAVAATIEDTTAETLDTLAKVAAGSPLGDFAARVVRARSAEKRADVLKKLLAQQRAHFDFKVIGALSGRSAGAGGINAQGIERGKLRQAFLLADPPEDGEGGDFKGFEVTIADAVYDDPALRADLRAGKSIHATFGADMYGLDPLSIKLTDVNAEEREPDELNRGWEGDLYNPSKHGVFSMIYGAQAERVASVMRLELDETAAGLRRFFDRFPMVEKGMERDQAAFCSMTQPGGIGSRVIWKDPADYAESLLGFRRYFTLENTLCKLLFQLAQHAPPSFKVFDKCGMKVKRRDRFQTPGGAVNSALYGAAFQIQARNMRAARNHRIQATGAHITKALQRAVWDEQPSGVQPWVARPYNVHDEVVAATRKPLTDVANSVVERFRAVVPLLAIGWKTNLKHWGEIK